MWLDFSNICECVCVANEPWKGTAASTPHLPHVKPLSQVHRYPEIFQKSPKGVVCMSANVRISSPGQEELETKEINKLEQN